MSATASFRRQQEAENRAQLAAARVEWLEKEFTGLLGAYNDMLPRLEERLRAIEERLDHLEMKQTVTPLALVMPPHEYD